MSGRRPPRIATIPARSANLIPLMFCGMSVDGRENAALVCSMGGRLVVGFACPTGSGETVWADEELFVAMFGDLGEVGARAACPKCGDVLPADPILKRPDGNAQRGDPTFCLSCAALLVFDEFPDGRLLPVDPPPAVRDAYMARPEIQKIHEAVRAVAALTELRRPGGES